MTRRSFGLAAAGAAVLGAAPVADAITKRARPFPLKSVSLRPGMFQNATAINRRYVMWLNPDRLLHTFRITAGLPSRAEPLGGWEAPVNELRGHFTGHYLSACAIGAASLRDEALLQRGNSMVAELAKCQKELGSGYLSAFPETLFDRARVGDNVWAPWYTIHKIMAGLLDMYTLGGNQHALEMLVKQADWVRRWVDPLGEMHMARVLEKEYGGMNEVLYNLYAITGDQNHFRVAHRFDHERFFAPLAKGRDELKGLHVNTQIPKVIGAARRYELTRERRFRDIAEYFWHQVTSKRCYATGGTSNDENWNSDPGKLAGELGGYTQECCVTYNMLRLTRQLFQWTPAAYYADYYERAMINGILGTQHPEDGMTLYYVALGPGYWKLFGLPLDAFWCCTGTGIESFSKLADSVYFEDEDGLHVNLFIASELDWAAKGITLIQDTKFPEEETTRFTIKTRSPQKFALRVRVPWWAGKGSVAKLNGKPLESLASPSSYLLLDRTWRDGETLEVTYPMSLRACPMPDDEALQAFMYGPIVLAGELGAEGLTKEVLRAEPTKPRDIPTYKAKPVAAPEFHTLGAPADEWIRAVPNEARHFQTIGQPRNVRLVPFYEVLDQRYAVYWKLHPRT